MKNLTEGNIRKNFLLFAVPMIAAGLCTQAFNLIDTVIAGKFLGDAGIAAVGATSAVITCISAIFWGCILGFSVYVAYLFGAGDFEKMKNGILNMLIFISVACFAVGAAAVIFYRRIFAFLNVDADIYSDAKKYFFVCALGLFFVILNTFFLNVMNALGSSTFPFVMSIVSALLNLTGNVVTVTLMGLGVLGIALATVASAAIVDLLYILKLFKCFRALNIEKRSFRLSFNSVRASAVYLLPCCIQQMSMYFSGLVISPSVNALGGSATAGYTVAQRIYGINAEVYQDSTKAMANYTSQSVGAGKYENIRKGIRTGLVQSMLFAVPFVAAFAVFATPICSMFFESGYDGDALTYSVMFSRICLPFIFINVVNNLFHAFFRGVGEMKLLIAGSLIGSLTRIAATWLMAPRLGMRGVYYAWAIGWGAEAVFCGIVFFACFRSSAMIEKRINKRVRLK